MGIIEELAPSDVRHVVVGGDAIESIRRRGRRLRAAELGNAIRSACAGHMILSPEATQVLAQSVAQPQIPGEQLTEREREVLKCMVDGLNNNAIPDKLVVSLGTVKFHISNIFHKLGVNSRVEAVKAAIEQKLV